VVEEYDQPLHYSHSCLPVLHHVSPLICEISKTLMCIEATGSTRTLSEVSPLCLLSRSTLTWPKGTLRGFWQWCVSFLYTLAESTVVHYWEHHRGTLRWASGRHLWKTIWYGFGSDIVYHRSNPARLCVWSAYPHSRSYHSGNGCAMWWDSRSKLRRRMVTPRLSRCDGWNVSDFVLLRYHLG
jgi:hypothetical protein